MSNEHRIGLEALHFWGIGQAGGGQSLAISIEQSNLVTCIEKRAAQSEESQGREMLMGDPASDGWVSGVDEQDIHSVMR